MLGDLNEHTWRVSPTVLTNTTPFTLPGPCRDTIQRGICTVDMVRNITLIAEDDVCLVALSTATLADGTVKTSPTLL